MKFWKWLYRLSRRKIMECHLEKHHNDIKCPNCRQWFSISGVDDKHEHVAEPEWGFSVKCGGCGHISHWNAVAAPVLLLSNEAGTPL